ncbi:hypothetical protein EDB92DRAFT_1818451 [Lactarius akahatsu]|uniref:Uncharacterized protein n=1 Tax=Lactarius akahatsu TaxID=416441 RepID=A0AAD4QB57_9AGAM|nr:hypothetical protein EDB92DRAFT_1819154 [Lactarius akahatsu]KAH8986150.1 hypothetical protein EDB92DRAFT_1818451 [Lactarius akahatsu]
MHKMKGVGTIVQVASNATCGVRVDGDRDDVPQQPALPLPVYNALFAGANDEFPVQRISRPDIIRALCAGERHSTPLDAIATALSDPTIFDFDLKLDSVLAASAYADAKDRVPGGVVCSTLSPPPSAGGETVLW